MAHSQRGLVVAPQAAHDFLSAHAHQVYRVTSFDNHHSPKTQRKACDMLHAKGYKMESVFDAAHGRRYMCFVYSTPEERKACWDFLTKFTPAR